MTVSELLEYIGRHKISSFAEIRVSIDRPFQSPKTIEYCNLHFETNGLDESIEIKSHVPIWEAD